MALDVYLFSPGTEPRTAEEVRQVGSFSDEEGDYWFFSPHFERLAAETGLMIDLYDTADFAAGALEALIRTLEEVRTSLADRPEQWEVVTGMQVHPEHMELRAAVRRPALAAWVDALKAAARTAQQEGLILRFHGD